MQEMAQPMPAVAGQVPVQTAAEPEVLRNLIVNYIPTTIDEMQMRQLFEMYGPIESVKIVSDRETRQSKGFGFVKYRFAFSASHAIQYLNGYPLMNKRLKVAYANAVEAQKASQTMLAPAQPQAGAMMYGGANPAPGADPAAQAYMQQMAAMQMMQQPATAVQPQTFQAQPQPAFAAMPAGVQPPQ